ncbi:hypothetical protein VKT23_008706 [Stygiomarasmius scandens]|uniref:Uncharacterized protein n=1 Tax=Marasmiellus scandens TaxID=2682957 RepID=A0ABR1JKG3_9AGAR
MQLGMKGTADLKLLMEALSLEKEQRKKKPTREKCSKFKKKAYQHMSLGSGGEPPELIDIEKEYQLLLWNSKTDNWPIGKWKRLPTPEEDEEDKEDFYDEDAFIDNW